MDTFPTAAVLSKTEGSVILLASDHYFSTSDYLLVDENLIFYYFFFNLYNNINMYNIYHSNADTLHFLFISYLNLRIVCKKKNKSVNLFKSTFLLFLLQNKSRDETIKKAQNRVLHRVIFMINQPDPWLIGLALFF